MWCSNDTGEIKRKKFQKEDVTSGKRSGAGNDVQGKNRVPKEVKNPAENEKASTKSTSVEMPPELCLVLGFSAAVIRSAYWVPSVMYRIKAAVIASQLRRSIHAPRIPVMEVVLLLLFSLDNCLHVCTYSECKHICILLFSLKSSYRSVL